MILKIKVPKFLGVYKLGVRAKARAVSNLARRTRKFYESAGARIDGVILIDGNKGVFTRNL